MQVENKSGVLPLGHPRRYGLDPVTILNEVKTGNISRLQRAISIFDGKDPFFFEQSKDVYLQFLPVFNKGLNKGHIDRGKLKKIIRSCQLAKVFTSDVMKKNVEILCSDGKTVKVNKFLHCMFSDYFEGVFNSSTRESQKKDGTYSITSEFPSDVILQYDAFLCTSDKPWDLSLESLCDLYLVADYYQVDNLLCTVYEIIDSKIFSLNDFDSWWEGCAPKLFKVLTLHLSKTQGSSQEMREISGSDKGKEKETETQESKFEDRVAEVFNEFEFHLLMKFLEMKQIPLVPSGKRSFILSFRDIYLLSQEGYFGDLMRKHTYGLNVKELHFDDMKDICQTLPDLFPAPFSQSLFLNFFKSSHLPKEYSDLFPFIEESFPNISEITFPLRDTNDFNIICNALKHFPKCEKFQIFYCSFPGVCTLTKDAIRSLDKITLTCTKSNGDALTFHVPESNESSLKEIKESLSRHFGYVQEAQEDEGHKIICSGLK